MARTTGARAILHLLAEAGIPYLFGNPGTTELPLMDAVAEQSRIRYILGLHETPIMAVADGFAMASRQVGVVNLHASCGLGNAMGMLYNAHREGTPLLVTAGQSDRRIRFEEPILWSDMTAVARPWTKWSAEIDRVEDVPAAIRRAVQCAITPPTGPVFLSLPMDVQMAEADLDLTPPRVLDHRVRPPVEAIRRAAELLLAAENPAILAGSRVAEAGGTAELVALAERLGAPVYSENATSHGRLPFPTGHSLYAQQLPLWAPDIRKLLADHDVLVVVGMDLLRMYVHHDPPQAMPPTAKLVHLDESAWQIGKNYPVEVGVLGDVRMSMAELADQFSTATASAPIADRVRERAARHAARHAAARDALRRQAESEHSRTPLTAAAFMDAVGRVLPANIAVVEEAVTTTEHRLERLGHLENTDGYFAHRGWALGWGMGCAVGVKLAWPDRPTLALIGDGAAMYGLQALWTAARYQVPVTFVLCNNGQYRILKDGARMLGLPAAVGGKYEGMDLAAPAIDFVALARALGVEAVRADGFQAVTDLVSQSLAGDGPRLIEVPIAESRASQFG
jgi:benzoylformate decarboxylase